MGAASSRYDVEEHAGSNYREVLATIHATLQPRNYFEIGTREGDTLALAKCDAIAVDPTFVIADPTIFSTRRMSLLYQMTSDDFFARFDPRNLFGEPVQFAFLDGMHRCEFLLRDFYNTEAVSAPNSVIALHDCLPPELPMTARTEAGIVPVKPSRTGWWTGDVWRTALLLKQVRPDLEILALDSFPTGLVLVTSLDPGSSYLKDNYNALLKRMMSYDLATIGIERFFDELRVVSTSEIDSDEKLTARFWL